LRADQLVWSRQARSRAGLRRAGVGRFRIAALCPALVYGRKGSEWSLAFLRSIARGHLLGLGAAGAGTANLVYVEDLTDFCERLISAAMPAFSIFNVNGFPAPTFNDYFGEIARGLGKKAREGGGGAVRSHGQMRRVVRGALQGLRRLLGPLLARSPRLASAFATACAAMGARPEDRAATAYSRQVFYSPDRAVAMGFVPRTPLDVGVRNSIAWADRKISFESRVAT
jgi:nucleoside-diphosphate-sugar epimerase